MRGILTTIGGAVAAAWLLGPVTAGAQDAARLLTIDHYVLVASAVPVIEGEFAQVYVRERVLAGTGLRQGARDGRVVLFVHGSGTPAEVAFDVPRGEYSWMAYRAQAGFDTFSMDATGYGRSTRPWPMNDPCNLEPAQQEGLVDGGPCEASYPRQLSTIASDWHDIDAVVDYLRALRDVEQVDLVAWSLGGPRAGGYAAQHPEKVRRLVLLAPGYNRDTAAAPPAELPAPGAAFTTQSRVEFVRNWDRQVGCADQYDPAVRDAVWNEMLGSDPVGSTWGLGVRRAPQVTTWGWTREMVAGTRIPLLAVAGIHDAQVGPDRVRELYEDFGAADKVLLDLGCASHNAMWERVHGDLFEASLEWLRDGTVDGMRTGVVRRGYPDDAPARAR
jgi:pimeloyl-ACP methyl ester carboxylesterase